MNLEQRLATAARLEKQGKLSINKDKVIALNGLVYVNRVPMTWDTFTHIYLFNIERNGGN